MANKPGYSEARKARGTATMSIEPMPAKPKTFTDKNLELGFGAGGANNFNTSNPKSGGSVKPEDKATPTMKPPITDLVKT